MSALTQITGIPVMADAGPSIGTGESGIYVRTLALAPGLQQPTPGMEPRQRCVRRLLRECAARLALDLTMCSSAV